jgi:hypothetical protein
MRNPMAEERLERGKVLRLDRFDGSIACVEGILWLSWKGSGDLCLFAGQEAELPRVRRLVAQPIKGPASFFFSGGRRAGSLPAARRGTMLKA